MKTIIIKIFFAFFGLLYLISCNKQPAEQVLAVRFVFDTNIGYISFIETSKNDTSAHLDTVIYDFLPTKANGYQFQLEFKKDNSNGDYLIIPRSCKKYILISDVKVNEDFTFSFLLNGVKMTDTDVSIDIIYNMLCD